MERLNIVDIWWNVQARKRWKLWRKRWWGEGGKCVGDSRDGNTSEYSSDNWGGGDENIVFVDDDLQGVVVQVQKVDRNFFHTHIVSVLSESIRVMPNSMRELDEPHRNCTFTKFR